MSKKIFFFTVVIGTLICLCCFAGVNIYVDPLFHYHGRNEKLQYPLWDERYMNDGIARHFEYDSIVTGTSEVENMKTSLYDSKWGVNSIKVPFSGASYKETADIINKGFEYHPDIKYVFRSMDTSMLLMGKDEVTYDEYPDYLYDNNILNDVHYVLNKDIFFKYTDYVFTFMSLGGNNTEFDVYKNWAGMYEYGPYAVLSGYNRPEYSEDIIILSDEDKKMISENISQNIIDIAVQHPNTQFYLFMPPYNVCNFDQSIRRGEFDRDIDAWEYATSLLVDYENIHLFCFFDKVETTCNLWNYKDLVHYNQEISDEIVDWMFNDEGLLTADNYIDYFNGIRAIYRLIDYDAFCTVSE